MPPKSDEQTSQAIIHLTASAHFIIRLNQNNFPTWRRQIESTLIGLDLYHHIDGNSSPPTATSSEYSQWYRQDQILFSALLGSCTDAIQPLISSATTSREAWQRLTTAYANTSRSRIISLKSKLTANPKGSRPVSDFLHEMRSIADELALAQEPVKDEDLMIHVLNQLGEEFKTIVAALKARDTSVSYSEMYAKLVDHEREIQATTQPSPAVITAHHTHASRPTLGNRTSYNGARSQRAHWQKPPSQQNGSRNSPHLASFCQFCSINGHNTKDCRKLARFLRDNNITINNEPVVNTTTTRAPSIPPSWLFDTGASEHAASPHSQLQSLSDYGGPEEIILGDGTGPSHRGAPNAGNQQA